MQKIMINLIIAMMLMLLVGCKGGGGSDRNNTAPTANAGEDNSTCSNNKSLFSEEPNPPSREELVQLLSKWRDIMVPAVDNQDRLKIEAFIAAYPIVSRVGIEPIIVESSGGENPSLEPKIGRRDWAYAVQGAKYTMKGGFIQGQSALLRIGFWSFLEAALLQPDEPEHLINVAFYLNNEQAYTDALKVLRYVIKLSPDNAISHSNMAYAYSGLHNYQKAFEEQLWVTTLDSTDQAEQQLEVYARQACVTPTNDAELENFIQSQSSLDVIRFVNDQSHIFESISGDFFSIPLSIDSVIAPLGAYDPMKLATLRVERSKCIATLSNTIEACVECEIPASVKEAEIASYIVSYIIILTLVGSSEESTFFRGWSCQGRECC